MRGISRLIIIFLLASGCSTLPGARPLEPGNHAVGLTLGGPMVDVGATIPMPNAVLEGRSGVTRVFERPLDVNYGLNLTPLAFGVAQGHVGGSWLAVAQRGWLPSIAVTDRVFVGANLFGRSSDAEGSFGLWGLNQLEVSLARDIGAHFLVWLSLSEYLDFGDPSLLLAPALGTWLDPGDDGGMGIGLEARWYGFNRRPPVDTVGWFPGPNGALGFALMVGYEF